MWSSLSVLFVVSFILSLVLFVGPYALLTLWEALSSKETIEASSFFFLTSSPRKEGQTLERFDSFVDELNVKSLIYDFTSPSSGCSSPLGLLQEETEYRKAENLWFAGVQLPASQDEVRVRAPRFVRRSSSWRLANW